MSATKSDDDDMLFGLVIIGGAAAIAMSMGAATTTLTTLPGETDEEREERERQEQEERDQQQIRDWWNEIVNSDLKDYLPGDVDEDSFFGGGIDNAREIYLRAKEDRDASNAEDDYVNNTVNQTIPDIRNKTIKILNGQHPTDVWHPTQNILLDLTVCNFRTDYPAKVNNVAAGGVKAVDDMAHSAMENLSTKEQEDRVELAADAAIKNIDAVRDQKLDMYESLRKVALAKSITRINDGERAERIIGNAIEHVKDLAKQAADPNLSPVDRIQHIALVLKARGTNYDAPDPGPSPPVNIPSTPPSSVSPLKQSVWTFLPLITPPPGFDITSPDTEQTLAHAIHRANQIPIMLPEDMYIYQSLTNPQKCALSPEELEATEYGSTQRSEWVTAGITLYNSIPNNWGNYLRQMDEWWQTINDSDLYKFLPGYPVIVNKTGFFALGYNGAKKMYDDAVAARTQHYNNIVAERLQKIADTEALINTLKKKITDMKELGKVIYSGSEAAIFLQSHPVIGTATAIKYK